MNSTGGACDQRKAYEDFIIHNCGISQLNMGKFPRNNSRK